MSNVIGNTYNPKSAGIPLSGLYRIEDNRIVVNIGRMRHQVSILQLGVSSPPAYDAGGPIQTYNPILANVAAAIDMIRGTDVIKGGMQTTELYLQIMIWFEEAVQILPSMRVTQQHNNSQYVIQSVENILALDQILILNCLGLGANV